MNKYVELKNKHQQEVNDFPKFFAFNDKQFEEGMIKLGFNPNQTNEIVSLGGTGGYIKKSDVKKFTDMSKRHHEEKMQAIADDVTGEGYIFDMFKYELWNHEYGYTGELEDTLDSLNLTMNEINQNSALKHGLEKATATFF